MKVKNLEETKLEEEIEDRRWCVYIHTNKINGKVYIGQTKNKPEHRWNNGKGYTGSTYFVNAINKYGWDGFLHEVIYDGLTQLEANYYEKYLIEYYNSTDPKYGYNIQSGGDREYNITEELRQKFRDRVTGENNPMYGKHHTEETKQKIRESEIGKFDGDKNPFYGKKHTEEAKQKIRESRRNISGENHPMHGKSWNDDVKEKIRISMTGKFDGENNPFYGKRHTDESKRKISENHWDSSGIRNPNYGKGNRVVQLTLDFSKIDTYISSCEAEKITGCISSGIRRCCKGNSDRFEHFLTSSGYIWLYEYDYINKFLN